MYHIVQRLIGTVAYKLICIEDTAVMTLGVFMAVKIEFMVFCAGLPCNAVIEYQHFGGPCCLHLQGSQRNYKQIKFGKCLQPSVWNLLYSCFQPKNINIKIH